MKIGITTTVPIEIIYAAGHVPVDLNNLFVSRPDYQQLVEAAEMAGFPRNFCAWVKGIYGTVLESGGEIDAVLAVTQGDCSNTKALMETLEAEGVEVIPFAYPYDRDRTFLKREMEKLMQRLGVGWPAVEETTRRLDEVRRKVWEIDRLAWQEGRVTGMEGHAYQITCSDMAGDLAAFEARVDGMLAEAQARPPAFESEASPAPVRLGYLGVPPMAPEVFDYLEELGARVVFHEVQRQFTLPAARGDLTDRYLDYTYPYSIFERLKDIEREVERRDILGVVHYVQSFCFRQVEDILLRRRLKPPLLTVELDRSTHLDARTRMRLENFVNMLREGRGR
jgi:benzoyl-CoA reductase/2-hydroxyglutaryl-CoA dehydratase subunit BcrC/BadD/HgdB